MPVRSVSLRPKRSSNRTQLADIANWLGLETAVEIGTHHAIFAYDFMRRFAGTISLIDPWANNSKELFYPYDFVSKSRDDDYYHAVRKMAEFGERVSFIRNTSENANSLFDDGTVGLVYIDGLHDYESISRDIRLWWPKLVSGGVLSGHDYCDTIWSDVIKAVDEHVAVVGVPVHLIKETPPVIDSWWMIKP